MPAPLWLRREGPVALSAWEERQSSGAMLARSAEGIVVVISGPRGRKRRELSYFNGTYDTEVGFRVPVRRGCSIDLAALE